MSIRTLVWGVLVAAAVFSFSTETYGQRGSLSPNQGARCLGGGYSDGYHWRTPGPCVDYYNPWSNHNTALRIGIVPQGAGPYLNRIENCGETVQSFYEPSGSGQNGDFIGNSTFEPAPAQSPTSNFFESKSNNEPNLERENIQSNGSDNNAFEADTSDSTQRWPDFSSFRPSDDSPANSNPEPDRNWASRFWGQRK